MLNLLADLLFHGTNLFCLLKIQVEIHVELSLELSKRAKLSENGEGGGVNISSKKCLKLKHLDSTHEKSLDFHS